MTADRCPRCDRAECNRRALSIAYYRVSHRGRPLKGKGAEFQAALDALLPVEDDCARHAVDWRTRALAAEQRAEDAEARESRLRAVVDARLVAAAITAGEMERAPCGVCTGFAPRFRKWLHEFDEDARAALAPAAESGKETP